MASSFIIYVLAGLFVILAVGVLLGGWGEDTPARASASATAAKGGKQAKAEPGSLREQFEKRKADIMETARKRYLEKHETKKTA